MNIPFKMTSSKQNWVRRASGLAAGLGLLLLTGHAYADDPYLMAPPIDSSYTSATSLNSPDSVFNWSEVPSGQEVPIQRAVFDQGGYQLFDRAGETIVVPFTDQNLYVMKFGESTNGSMYFVNEGNVPVLYVPRNGYLENAAVPGARWYPFSETFHPNNPVFLGIAPSWHVFLGMGWYSGMYCHGGYWHETPYVEGRLFLPSFGLFFEIGGHHYDGWNGYHDYYNRHPAPYHVTIVNNYVYEHASRPNWGGRQFQGGDQRDYASHSFGQGRVYPTDRGGSRSFPTDRPLSTGRVFQGSRPDSTSRGSQTYGNSDRAYGGGNPTFGGGTGRAPSGSSDNAGRGRPSGGVNPTFSGGRPFGGDRTPTGEAPVTANHTFGGGTRANNGSDHTFSSNHASSSGIDRPSSGSGSDAPSYSGRSSRPFGGADRGGSAGGGQSSNGNRANNNGGGRTNSVGDHSVSSDHSVSGGGQPFGGGGRPFGGRPR